MSQADDIADAIDAMRPLANKVAQNLTGKTVAEIATLMAYTLLLLEHALETEGKGMLRARTLHLVGDIADTMRAADILGQAEVPTDTRQ